MSFSIRYSVSVFIAFVVLFFAGCKKDAAVSGLPTSVTVSNVKSTISTSPTGALDTFVYTYDGNGRQLSNKTDTVVTSYVYASGTVTMNIALAGEIFTTIYNTNSAGQAISDTKGNTYSYDSLGYLTLLAHTISGGYDSTVYTIVNGNVTTSVLRQIDAATNNTVTTTYTYLSTVDSRNYGLAFLGKQNTNLISTENITQVINGATYTSSYTYTYTFDNQGRVVQQLEASGSDTYTTSYTY